MSQTSTERGNFPLDVPYARLHPDWHRDWAPTLRNEANRLAIVKNPRLERRPGADLAARLGVPDLSAAANIDLGDQIAYQVAIESPERFRRVLGLAVLSPVLAVEIEPDRVRRLREQCDPSDLALAFQARMFAEPIDALELDMDRIGAIADAEGRAILEEWLVHVPLALSGRIRLTLPKSTEPTVPETRMSLVRLRLLREVGRKLLRETAGGGEDAGRA